MDDLICAKEFKANEQSVLFVTSQLRQREIKMAYALRSRDWMVGLIYYNSTPFKPNGLFDYIKEVKSAYAAYKYAKKLKPTLIHVFSGAIDDYVMLFSEEKLAPVVIDLNDVFAPSLMDYCKERYAPTRKALALADGFCARDLQIKCAQKQDHYQVPPQQLFYPEYCWDMQKEKSTKKSNDDIHIVSVGTISLETYGMYDCCYLTLVDLITQQGIHLHFYPPWHYRKDYHLNPNIKFERDYAQFIEIEKNNPYFHLHDSLAAEELTRELSQYDFGIISGGCEAFGQRYSHFKPAYVESCYSGRITDYLDAGLPVLINKEVKFDHWLLKRYSVSVDLKDVLLPNFKEKLHLAKQDPQLKQNVAYARAKLSIKANAIRLTNFYTNIIRTAVPVLSKRRFIYYRHVFKNIKAYRPNIKRVIRFVPNRIVRLKRFLLS